MNVMTEETPENARPRGRDEVRAAVLDATRELVAERGLDRFSVRDIAGRAGINHALVHRYFGTKAAVVEEMLADEAKSVADAIAQSGAVAGAGLEEIVSGVLGVMAERPTYWRALAYAVLDEPDVAVPGTSRTTEMFSVLWAGEDPNSSDATAVAGVVTLGWLIFGSFVSESTKADPEHLRQRVVDLVCSLVAPGYERSNRPPVADVPAAAEVN